jgi:hypothetical protein
MEQLLSEIESFCEAQGMKPTTFGELAMGDKRFVHDLMGKNGKPRRVWPETADRVRNFMVTYRPQERAA